jgi:hypothetical protein
MGGVFQQAKQSSGGSGGGGVVSSTFNSLKVLVSSNSLVPGQEYSFSFQTKYQQLVSNAIKTGTSETIIIKASSLNSFDRVARSADHPEDIIWFDFTDQLCEDGSTPRQGKIIYRNDTINNNLAYYDIRNIKFLRYTSALSLYTAWVATTLYNPGDIRKNGTSLYRCRFSHTSTASFANDLNGFKWEDISNTLGQKFWNTTISILGGTFLADATTATEYLTFANGVKNCSIGKNLSQPYNNIIILWGSDNAFGKDCYNATIDYLGALAYPAKNIFKDGVNNIIIDTCSDNTIEEDSSGIFLSLGANSNTVKKGSSGTFISFGCMSNVIGEQSVNVYIFNYSHYNTLDQDTQYCYFNNYSKDNKIGSTSNNIVLYNSSQNSIGRNNANHVFNMALQNICGENCSSIKNSNTSPSYGQMTGNVFSNEVSNVIISGILIYSNFGVNVSNITISASKTVSNSRLSSGVSNKTINANWTGVGFEPFDTVTKTYTTDLNSKTVFSKDSNGDVYYADIDTTTGAITTNKLI